MHSGIPYEFRTTIVPGLHTEKSLLDLSRWIKEAKRYFLQQYQESKILNPEFLKKNKGKKLDLEKIKNLIEENFEMVGIR